MVAILILLQIFLLRSMRNHSDTVTDFLQQRRGRDPLQAFYASRIHRIQRWSLCLCCCLCLLCVRISVVSAEEDHLQECSNLYTEIIDIQERRKKFQEGANMLMEMFDRGLMTKKKLDNTLWVWHTIESKLRTEATALYDKAYERGCFDESIRTERRDAP
jgi:hypothetical protein